MEEELQTVRQSQGESVTVYAECFQYTHAQGDELPTLTVLSRYWVRGLLGERVRAIFLRGPKTWDDVVMEVRRVESAERLLGVNAHAMMETQRTLLPVNALKGFGCEGSGEAILADLLARVGCSHGAVECTA